WAEDVRAYLNLEAGGVGGRAMLFRASHSALLSAYKRSVEKPSASLVGNDAMRLGIVRSDTDFSVYTTRYGVPGLDLAFTDHRNFYHSQRDNVHQATTESVLSMGAAALSVTREIADSDSTLASIPRSSRLPQRPRAELPQPQDPVNPALAPHSRALVAADESFGALRDSIRIQNLQHVVVTKGSVESNAVDDTVFYDVLSRFMVVRSYARELGLNVATGILGIALIVALQYPFTRPLPARAQLASQPEAIAARKPVERLILQLGQGGFFSGLFEGLRALLACYLAGLFGSLIFTGTMLNLVAPRIAYTHLYLQLILQFSAAALSATCVLTGWTRRSRLPDMENMIWYSSGLLRCIVLLLIVVPLNASKIGLLYREQIYAWASLIAATLTALMDTNAGINKTWRSWLARVVPAQLGHQAAGAPPDEHDEHLLPRSSTGSSRSENDAAHLDLAIANTLTSTDIYVRAALLVISSFRLLFGVIIPLLIGVDTMMRQLIALKDHLPDGSPPIACIALAALDIVTFVVFLAPYALNTMLDIDRYWFIRYIGRVSAPYIHSLLLRSQTRANAGGLFSSVRSQISLHTNRPSSRRSIDSESPSSFAAHEPASAEQQQLHEEDGNNGAEESIIVLGSGARMPDNEASSIHSGESRASVGSNDDELGNRPADIANRKRESPETVGVRMVYVWTGVWLVVWVISQLYTLFGESYDEQTNPLKVRVYQESRVSTQCLRGSSAGCTSSMLSLISPDSHGLAGLVQRTTPQGAAPICYTMSTQGLYVCRVPWNTSNLGRDSWSPAKAITITNITHVSTQVDHGTLFTVSVNFTAPETRTCFIDLGSHRGFSPQAYPNPRPVLPPSPGPNGNGTEKIPAIGRVVLPIVERAGFVDGKTGATAPLIEHVHNRDPIFSGRIFAHKRDFADGRFSANIQYSVPQAKATKPRGLFAEVTCYFDLVDKHVPLLASIRDASPSWVSFTPHGNTLSTVTLADVEI
ncbi:hypothetical protein GGI12_000036, partial [Dipsacomyces acuminosporus]